MRGRGWFFGFLISVICCGIATTRAEEPFETDIGVVISKIGKSSILEKFGLREGYTLHSWKRLPNENCIGEEGVFDSVFTWDSFLLEQTGRGIIQLLFKGSESEQTIDVPLGDWSGTKVRPIMPEIILGFYIEGKTLVDNGQLSDGVLSLEKALEIARLNGLSDLSCWLQLCIGEVWSKEHEWDKVDFSLDSAMKLANNPWARLSVLGKVAQAEQQRDQFDKAEATFKKQLEIWRKNNGDSLGFSYFLDRMGEMARRKGMLQVAEKRFKASLMIREKYAPYSLPVASSFNGLGAVAWQRSALDTATEYFKIALSIRNKHSPDSLLVASSLNSLGVVEWKRGNLKSAIKYYEESLKIRNKLRPGDLMVAASHNNIGILFREVGDLGSAKHHLEASLEIKRKLAPSSIDLSISLVNLGHLYIDYGDLNVAEKYMRESLEIIQKKATDNLDAAPIFHGLGHIAYYRGDFETAEAYYNKALFIIEKLIPNSLEHSDTYNNLGNISQEKGDLSQAKLYYNRSLEIVESLGTDNLDIAICFHNLGNVALKQKLVAEAVDYFQRSLAIQKNLAPGSVDMAASLEALGIISFERGNLDDAIEYFESALEIFEKLSPGTIGEAGILGRIGRVYQWKSDKTKAVSYFERSIISIEQQLGKLGGSGNVKTKFQAKTENIFRDYINFLISQKLYKKAFTIHERARAKVLYQMISERDLVLSGQGVSNDLERSRKQLAYQIEKILEQLANLNSTTNVEQIEILRSRYYELRGKYDGILVEIRDASPRLAELRAPKPLNLARTKNMLAPGTALLSYYIADKKTYLFVIQKQAEIEVYHIQEGQAFFQEQIEKLHSEIKDFNSTVARNFLDHRSRELFDLLLTPAIKTIEASTRLVIIPDGPLHKLPFYLLSDSTGRRLIERKPVSTIVSATIFRELKERKTSAKMEIFAFGDPIYPESSQFEAEPVQIVPLDDTEGTKLRGDSNHLEFLRANPNKLNRLPYTSEEVRNIKGLFPGRTRLFLNDQATEENIKGVGKEPTIIHLACHGWANDRFPLESALAFSIGDQLQTGQENGILQAWEIFDSMWINADLLVLSACETGLGEITGAEGLIGLTRAFQYVGARSIVASFWNVEDQSTSVLMKQFYQYLKTGLPKDEALRQAQIDLIRQPLHVEKTFFFDLFKRTVKRDVSHPYYWGAFQLIGPWD